MRMPVAEPCDTGGGATLIADTGSGHVPAVNGGGAVVVAELNGFGQVTSDSTGSLGRPR